MTPKKKAIIVLGGLLGALVTICILSRLWPFIALSLLRRGMQTEIHCWVRVVDQEGKGVQGYRCRVVEEHAPLLYAFGGNDAVRIFETGEDGSFEYKSKGTTGRVFFGYSWDTEWTLNPKQLLQQRDLAITSLDYRRRIGEKPTGYLGSRENPYLLHVFTVGTPQKLLYWKTRVKLKEMGDYLCVDFLSGRTWESQRPEGDVAMADGQYTKEGAPRCGTRMIAGVNCSLYPVVDDWGLEPPEGGYVKELCFGKDWEDKHKSYHQIQYYYCLESPAIGRIIYGRLTFGPSPRVDGAQIESYTNLQGERNLFYKGYTDLMDQKILDYVSPPVQ